MAWKPLNAVHIKILTFVLDKEPACIVGGFAKTRAVWLPQLKDAGMMTSSETLAYLVNGGWLQYVDDTPRFKLTKKGRKALE